MRVILFKSYFVFLSAISLTLGVPSDPPITTPSGPKLSFLVSGETVQGIEPWTVNLSSYDIFPQASAGLQPGFYVYPTCKLYPLCYSLTTTECARLKVGPKIPRLPIGLLQGEPPNYFLTTQEDTFGNNLFWKMNTLPLNHLWATSLETEQTVLLMESPKIPYIFAVDASNGIIFWGSEFGNGIRRKFINGEDTSSSSERFGRIRIAIVGLACDPLTETVAAMSPDNRLWILDYEGTTKGGFDSPKDSSDEVVSNNTLALYNQTMYWFYYKTVNTNDLELPETSMPHNPLNGIPESLPGLSGSQQKVPYFSTLIIRSGSRHDLPLEFLAGDEIISARIELPKNSKPKKSCSTGDCPYVCLFDSETGNDRCACPSWMLQVDKRTCKAPAMVLILSDTKAHNWSEVRTTGVSDTLSLTYNYKIITQSIESSESLINSSLQQLLFQHRIGQSSRAGQPSGLNLNQRSPSNPQGTNVLSSSRPQLLRFEPTTNCIQATALNSPDKYWSIFCSPALDPQQFALDLNEPILFWRNKQTEKIYKTRLSSAKSMSTSTKVAPQPLNGNWLIALDTINRIVHWLSSTGVHNAHYDDKDDTNKTVFQFEQHCIKSKEFRKHFLHFHQDRLYWIEEQAAGGSSFIVKYDIRLGFKEVILKAPENTFIDSFLFPSQRNELPQTGAASTSLCTHFAAPPSGHREGHCWCPEEMPFLLDSYLCLPSLLLAKKVTSESKQSSTTPQTSIEFVESIPPHPSSSRNPTQVVKSLFSLKVDSMNASNFVFDTNGDIVCWVLDSIKCVNRTNVDKTPSISATSISPNNRILRLDSSGSVLYFNGPQPETINIVSLPSAGSLSITDPSSFVSKLTSINEIDGTRKILLWCNNENHTLNMVSMHKNPQNMQMLWKFRDNDKCQSLASDEMNSRLYVAMSNQIYSFEYGLPQKPNADRYPKPDFLHRFDFDILSDLQYFQNHLFWKGQNRGDLAFIEMLNLERLASKASRVYQSKPGEEMLGFRVFQFEPKASTKQCSHFTFPRNDAQGESNNSPIGEEMYYVCMCPTGMSKTESSNYTECATTSQGMSVTAVIGYIVAPLLFLIPATLCLVILLVKMCVGRKKKVKRVQESIEFAPVSPQINNYVTDPSRSHQNY